MLNNNKLIKSCLSASLKLACTAVLAITTAQANDSTGYVGTGGVAYLKNKNISMHSEDLYISKNNIRVNYEFKNLSNKDITETVLFPMPAAPSRLESDFADTTKLVDSFKIVSNGKPITAKTNVRTFMHPLVIEAGQRTYADNSITIDTTEIFKACGVKDSEMMIPWTNQGNTASVDQKLQNCTDKRLNKFINTNEEDSYLYWQSQIVYSWQQTFKANATTKINHSYQPLVGGSVHLGEEEFATFCLDGATEQALSKTGARPYHALSYILTTGANWAKPIANFKLTVERDPNELVSFCWKGKGKVKKVNAMTFEIKETNFVPKHDFEVAFIMKKW
ncbi:DUF4424 family protein [Psychrobacter sp. BF1]|uniref:DUF4424 family protein n=1 Tax=Psychrobacter sp. BF1 TaxID=2821147 RepID=UPI001C4DFEDB|nr:DUF4424 family protein [Psychrobacter sp. BF1]